MVGQSTLHRWAFEVAQSLGQSSLGETAHWAVSVAAELALWATPNAQLLYGFLKARMSLRSGCSVVGSWGCEW